MKLLMITGLGSAKDLASGKKGAFYNTLEEFHKYFERIDIIAPKVQTPILEAIPASREPSPDNFKFSKNTQILFGNVYVHISPLPIIFHPLYFIWKSLQILKANGYLPVRPASPELQRGEQAGSLAANNYLMTVHEFPPFYNGVGAWIISVFTKIPYILEIHHIPGYPKAGNTKDKVYRWLMSLFIRFDAKRAKAVRVVNQKETPDFLVKAGIPREKIIYIPSAYIDLLVFRPMALAKEYDVIFVGRLVKNKGINLFIEAVKKTKVRAIIVGDGPLAEILRRKIKNENLEKQITFHGWAKNQREIAELLNKSKVLIMSSYNEGGPRVVVEAMACGVPVLATNIGIVPDLLKNGCGGEIIDWSPDDISRKIMGLLNDQDKYQRYSQGGPEIVVQFEREATIKNYAEKLQNVIK